MSDYLFLMESRLSPEQWQVVLQMQKAAESLGINLYMVGGAIRDLIGGFPIDDLDFVVEGDSRKLVRALVREGVEIRWQSEPRRAAELEFPGGISGSVSMARSETYAKPPSPPMIFPAPIVADLRRRDFSINAIGLSLNPHSRGLLLDPTNGVSDIEKKVIRVLHNYSFFDDPVRMFRAVRFRTRLRYSWEPKTAAQFQNALNQGFPAKASGEGLGHEVRQWARERNPAEILKALEKERLLGALSPRLRGTGLNWQGIAKATKTGQSLAEAGLQALSFSLFLYLLFRKLPARERTQLVKRLNLKKMEWKASQKVETDAQRLAKELIGKKASTPTKLYQLLSTTSPDLIVLLVIEFPQKKIQSRIKTFLQKHLRLRSQLPEKELEAMGVAPGTEKYRKILEACFYATLEGEICTPSQQKKFLNRMAPRTEVASKKEPPVSPPPGHKSPGRSIAKNPRIKPSMAHR